MEDKNLDQPVRKHIEDLVNEEHRLRAHKAPKESDDQRLKAIQVELDQCWDLLRQRRALREFGGNEDTATPRDVDVVERYKG